MILIPKGADPEAEKMDWRKERGLGAGRVGGWGMGS